MNHILFWKRWSIALQCAIRKYYNCFTAGDMKASNRRCFWIGILPKKRRSFHTFCPTTERNANTRQSAPHTQQTPHPKETFTTADSATSFCSSSGRQWQRERRTESSVFFCSFATRFLLAPFSKKQKHFFWFGFLYENRAVDCSERMEFEYLWNEFFFISIFDENRVVKCTESLEFWYFWN